jgi:energy-converting hydrogenase A subunit M
MENQELLECMKLRILRSFKWREDIVIPLSNEFKISPEDFEHILMDNLDMSDLESLHATLESAETDYTLKQLHLDLKLYWFLDVLKIISTDESDALKLNLLKKIQNGEKYSDVLSEGKNKLIAIMKSN